MSGKPSIAELQESLRKKDKIIASLTQYVERLSQNQESVISGINTTRALERKLQKEQSELSGAKEKVSQSERQLQQERDFIRATMNSLAEGVIVTDLTGSVLYGNPSSHQLLNKIDELFAEQPITKLLKFLDSDKKPVDVIAIHKKSNSNQQHTAFLVNANHQETVFRWSSATISNNKEEPQGIVYIFNDITASHKLEKKLNHQASHDKLTGLLNRHAFDQRLKNCLTSKDGIAHKHSLIYIDLDQFKVVNDTCGHQAGDELLQQLSTLIFPLVRERDTLARIGGDEFAVLLEKCPNDAARKIAEEILKTIQDFRFSWQTKSFTLGASIGIVHFSSNASSNNNPLSMADATCYKAKDEGRNRIHEVDITDEELELGITHEQMHWVSRLNNAIDNGQFVLYQQKIIATNPGANDLLHYEVLLRLRDDDGNIINSGAFLPPAERYGLINRVDQWVVKNTLAWLAAHPTVLAKTKLCSINLSGVSLSDQTLSDYVTTCINEYGIDSRKICFEITETSAIQNLGLAMSFMNNMHKLGCSFSLDDFGTGMSSFSYLKNLPVNNLKIDGTFVRDIHKDPIDLAMTRSINEIGHVMGMSTIGEFVENKEIFQRLKQLGVDYAQGFHIARPAPIDTLLDEIKT